MFEGLLLYFDEERASVVVLASCRVFFGFIYPVIIQALTLCIFLFSASFSIDLRALVFAFLFSRAERLDSQQTHSR